MMNAIVVGAALAIGAGSALAQKPATPNPDQRFMVTVARDGMAEVELGKMAAEKGTSSEVKSFGQRMVDDHGRAGEELKTLAQNKGVALPPDLDARHKALRDRLLKMSGESFDHTYMAAMVDGHRQALNAFRTESRSGKDADVKTWAAKTLPAITEHLKLATAANRVVGTSGRK